VRIAKKKQFAVQMKQNSFKSEKYQFIQGKVKKLRAFTTSKVGVQLNLNN
jgi:hypothetical protein